MPEFWVHLYYFAGILVAAACFAIMEIQIEGPAGWAQNLPTWRVRNPRVKEWMNRLFPGRPITGYHASILVFIAIVAHLPFALGMPWTPGGQARAVAFIIFFWVAEDFLWFVLNPHFGLRKFRPQHIEWHRKAWWWIAPRDYWIGLALAVTIYVLSRGDQREIIVAMRQ
ncbi:MAG: hypothetical protein IPM64_11170 [Phycisphaerales bacterium]|nr:hypothetical protein [Phycisphaerales bacterium]